MMLSICLSVSTSVACEVVRYEVAPGGELGAFGIVSDALVIAVIELSKKEWDQWRLKAWKAACEVWFFWGKGSIPSLPAMVLKGRCDHACGKIRERIFLHSLQTHYASCSGTSKTLDWKTGGQLDPQDITVILIYTRARLS